MNNRNALTTLLGCLIGVAGCSHQKTDSTVSPVADADQINARTKFETIKDPPMNVETRFAAGQLAETQQAWPQAIRQYDEALKLNPTHLGALYRLGVLHAQLKEYPEAIDSWKQYIKATHDAAAGYSNLGFCYELAGRPDDAERTYQKGIQKDSASSPCRVNYGLMLARHDRLNEAMIQLQAVLTPAEVHYNLASVYEIRGRKEQAKIEYRKAVELDPKFTDAQARLDAMQ